MKQILLLSAVLATSAQASDFATTFSIPGGITEVSYNTLELDLSFTDRYMTANGSIRTGVGLGSPTTGTCQLTSSGGAFCILQTGFINFVVDLGPNLTGTIKYMNASGDTVQVAPISISFVE